MAAFRSERVAADPSALSGVLDWLEGTLETGGVPASIAAKLMLCADEIGANIANYAYDADGWFELEVEVGDHAASIAFIDAGRPFDPTIVEEPDTTLPLDERPIGGVGVLLVRRLMDRFDYRRVDGTNRVTIGLGWAD